LTVNKRRDLTIMFNAVFSGIARMLSRNSNSCATSAR